MKTLALFMLLAAGQGESPVAAKKAEEPCDSKAAAVTQVLKSTPPSKTDETKDSQSEGKAKDLNGLAQLGILPADKAKKEAEPAKPSLGALPEQETCK